MKDDLLDRYRELLDNYKGTLDLVSPRGMRDIGKLIEEAKQYAHVIRSVHEPAGTILDLGSGAGLPGIVVAAMLPESKVHLVERRRRRGAFLQMAVGSLGLENAHVVADDVVRIDDLCVDVVTAQAVSTLASVARLTRHLHKDPCYIVSRRGPDWLAELPALQEFVGDEMPGAPQPPRPSPGTLQGDDNSLDIRSGEQAPASAESNPAVAVVVERRLERDGSLVALRLAGGRACLPSG